MPGTHRATGGTLASVLSVPHVIGLLSPTGWAELGGGGRGKGVGQQAAAGEGVRLLHSSSPPLPPAASNARGSGDGRVLPPSFSIPLPSKSSLFN